MQRVILENSVICVVTDSKFDDVWAIATLIKMYCLKHLILIITGIKDHIGASHCIKSLLTDMVSVIGKNMPLITFVQGDFPIESCSHESFFEQFHVGPQIELIAFDPHVFSECYGFFHFAPLEEKKILQIKQVLPKDAHIVMSKGFNSLDIDEKGELSYQQLTFQNAWVCNNFFGFIEEPGGKIAINRISKLFLETFPIYGQKLLDWASSDEIEFCACQLAKIEKEILEKNARLDPFDNEFKITNEQFNQQIDFWKNQIELVLSADELAFKKISEMCDNPNHSFVGYASKVKKSCTSMFNKQPIFVEITDVWQTIINKHDIVRASMIFDPKFGKTILIADENGDLFASRVQNMEVMIQRLTCIWPLINQ